VIIRQPLVLPGLGGHLCGYVGVPTSHKLYGFGYDSPLVRELHVHGGITYSKFGNFGMSAKSYWYFGFDCFHFCDISDPKDETYVQNEIDSLLCQLG
jgi:hypothetical protein